MSFIEENVEEAAAPDYENRERWMEALEEHQDGIGVVYGRGVRTAELPREKRKKLTRGLIWLWVILFCVAVAYASVHLAAQSCKRGRDNSMWIITVVAADIVITIASLCFGVVGILIKDEIFMQQAAALHAVAAIWHTLQGLFYLFFVLLLSKIAGEWLRGGRYKQQQIADFNAFLNALIFIGVILVLLCVASSRQCRSLSYSFEVMRVSKESQEREEAEEDKQKNKEKERRQTKAAKQQLQQYGTFSAAAAAAK